MNKDVQVQDLIHKKQIYIEQILYRIDFMNFIKIEKYII